MSPLSDWIEEVARELGISELGELVDPAVVQPLVLDMTRDVAHAVARPAAPITAYLLGLAAGRAAGAGPPEPELAHRWAEHLAVIARARTPGSGTEPGSSPVTAPEPDGSGATPPDQDGPAAAGGP